MLTKMKIISDIIISGIDEDGTHFYKSGSHELVNQTLEEHLITLDNGIRMTVAFKAGQTPNLEDILLSLTSQVNQANHRDFGDHPIRGFHD
jgi:hypothetical protein